MAGIRERLEQRVRDVQAKTKQLFEPPAGLPRSFPQELARKPLIDLIVEQLKEAEVETVWLERIDENPDPQDARRAQKMRDRYERLENGQKLPDQEKAEMLEYIKMLEDGCLFPQLKQALSEFGKDMGPGTAWASEPAKEVRRMSMLLARCNLRLHSIIKQNRAVIATFSDKSDMPETIEGLGLHLQAGIEPESGEQATRVGRKAMTPEQAETASRIVEDILREAAVRYYIARAALSQCVAMQDTLMDRGSRRNP